MVYSTAKKVYITIYIFKDDIQSNKMQIQLQQLLLFKQSIQNAQE